MEILLESLINEWHSLLRLVPRIFAAIVVMRKPGTATHFSQLSHTGHF